MAGRTRQAHSWPWRAFEIMSLGAASRRVGRKAEDLAAKALIEASAHGLSPSEVRLTVEVIEHDPEEGDDAGK